MIKRQIILSFLLALPLLADAQTDTLRLTLSEAIALAQEQSSEAKVARHTFLAAEWNYKYYRANYLPSLTFTSTPNLNRVISKITLPDGTSTFVKQNQLSTDATLSITQNIPFTGGQLFLNTSLQRQDEFENKT
ncbi:MAG: TolC family protein, partial [Bacteroidaceae bacterium]|nr:TolC family protein [Bacteroidaceae bacterium]